jgi:hypothetical protein
MILNFLILAKDHISNKRATTVPGSVPGAGTSQSKFGMGPTLNPEFTMVHFQ